MPHTRAPLLFIAIPSALLIAALLYEVFTIYMAPEARVLRLLSSPPENMQLRTPLWDYKKEEELDWTVGNLDNGMVSSYRSIGTLPVNPEDPLLEIESGGKRIAKSLNWDGLDVEKGGYVIEPGDERVLLGSYFFASDHTQIYSGNIPWDSPILEWKAQPIHDDPEHPLLVVSLDDVYSATQAISKTGWATYRVHADAVQAGSYTLSLKSVGAYSTPDKTVQRQFFLKDFKAVKESKIEVRIPSGSQPPKVLYSPQDPVASVLSEPPRSSVNEIPHGSNGVWGDSAYDASDLFVRPVEIEGIVRTCLFMPTRSEWVVSITPEFPADLVFYPTIRDPRDPEKLVSGNLRVDKVGPPGSRNSRPVPLWSSTLRSGSLEETSLWNNGVRIPLTSRKNEPITLRFHSYPDQTAPGEKGVLSQPVYLGEPMLFPALDVRVQSPDQTMPDVVLISVDTLRGDAVSCIGDAQGTTPWMDRFFGKNGVVFPKMEAPCSWTLPSHASLFLSQYPSRHGVRMGYDTIPGWAEMFTEELARYGYETAAFADREYLNYHFGFHQGFEFFDQLGGHFKHILPRCQNWLARRDRRVPLFLFLHSYDVHQPYTPPREFRDRFVTAGYKPSIPELGTGKEWDALMGVNRGTVEISPEDTDFVRQLYLAEVAYTDFMLRQFFDQAIGSGLLNDPLVILLSDHGEAFCEHGSFLHSWTLYEEEIHVPFLVRFPGNEHAGTRIEERVSLIDTAPTLFDILGLDALEDWQGLSLLPLIKGEEWNEGDRSIYSELKKRPEHLSAIFKKAMKYIETRREPVVEDRFHRLVKQEAFDLAEDPLEKEDLASKIPEETTRELRAMSKVLNGMLAERLKDGDIPAADLDPETVRGLQALNYLGGGPAGQ